MRTLKQRVVFQGAAVDSVWIDRAISGATAALLWGTGWFLQNATPKGKTGT